MNPKDTEILDVVEINGKSAYQAATEAAEFVCRKALRLNYLPIVTERMLALVLNHSELWDDREGESVPAVMLTLRRYADNILTYAVIEGPAPVIEGPAPEVEEVPEIPSVQKFDPIGTLVSGVRANDLVSSIAGKVAGGDKELEQELEQDLMIFLYSRPSLWDVEKIRESHEKKNRKPDDPNRNYSAGSLLKAEAVRLKQEKERERSNHTVLPYEKLDLEEDLKAWQSSGLPDYVKQALASDRLPESYRTALEDHYLAGKTSSQVGRMTLARARARLADIVPSFQSDSQKIMISEHSLDAMMEENADGNSEWSHLEPKLLEAQPVVIAPVAKFASFYRDMSEKRYRRNLLGPGAIGQDLGGFDVEPELYFWANGGRKIRQELRDALDGLTEDDRTLLHIRYDNSRDVRSKREHHEASVAALSRLRGTLGLAEGVGVSG